MLTFSAVGLATGSFWRQASMNEQNSGEKSLSDSEGDGSSKIFNVKQREDTSKYCQNDIKIGNDFSTFLVTHIL